MTLGGGGWSKVPVGRKLRPVRGGRWEGRPAQGKEGAGRGPASCPWLQVLRSQCPPAAGAPWEGLSRLQSRIAGSIPGLAQWVKDPALLWLWCRLVATAPIRSLEPGNFHMPRERLKKKAKRPKKKKKKNYLMFNYRC